MKPLPPQTKGILLALFCTLIVSIAQILLKKASVTFSLAPSQILQQFSNYPLVVGVALYIIGAFFFVKAFRLGDLSVIYPVMASGYVVVTILSVFFLQEVIVFQKWIGMAFITFGVILIGRSGGKQ